jgi:hypothetical protein
MSDDDDVYHWYLRPTGCEQGDPTSPPADAVRSYVFHSPNKMYSTAYWAGPHGAHN